MVPKSFCYAQSRRSGKPPLCKGRWQKSLIFDGGIDLIVTIPQSACSADSPLYTRGPFGAHLTTSVVVGHYTQAKKLDAPIGSVGSRPPRGRVQTTGMAGGYDLRSLPVADIVPLRSLPHCNILHINDKALRDGFLRKGACSCGSKISAPSLSRFFGYFLMPIRKYRPRQGINGVPFEDSVIY